MDQLKEVVPVIGSSQRMRLSISAVLIVVFLIGGATALAQDETQTPSEDISTGPIKVIERELADSGVQSESKMVSEAESLIDSGVPPGIVVSAVKSLKTGHLSPEELEGVFTDLEENVAEGETPPGLIIKSIKTAYQLPEDFGKPEEAGPPEDKGKPEEAGPPENKGEADDKGPPEDKGKPEEAGPPDDKSEKEENGKSDKGGPPEDEGEDGDKGPPEEAGERGKKGENDKDEDKGKGKSE